MGIRNAFSKYVFNQARKRGWIDNVASQTVRWGGGFFNDENVLQSSDVSELLQDISSQIVLAEPVVLDNEGNEYPNNRYLKMLKNPNNYMTGAEFMKLQINTLLLQGEVYPVMMGDELHLMANIQNELDDQLIEHFKTGDTEIPGSMIRHIKQIGTRYDRGSGLLELGRKTLEGVMNAEGVLNNKYKKGGLLAFLLKLDAVISPNNKTQGMLVDAILAKLDEVTEEGTTKMIPLGKGYEIESLESPIEDDKVLNYLNVYKPDLGKYLGINVDTYQSMMKSNIENAMMYLHNKVVKPILKNLSEHYTLLFFGANSNKHIEWRINILDFVPYSTKTNIAYNLVRTMVDTPDDARRMLGEKPLNTEASSMLYVSKDLIGATDLSNATDDSNLKGGDNSAEDGD